MKTIQITHDTNPSTPNGIRAFAHCSRCASNVNGESPASWARLSVGFTADGNTQIWCERHQVNVDRMTIKAPTLKAAVELVELLAAQHRDRRARAPGQGVPALERAMRGEGFFDNDADYEQAELENAGRNAYARIRKAHKLIEQGQRMQAAEICPHSWTSGIPGENLSRCLHCGSALSGGPFDFVVVRACEVPPKDDCTCSACKRRSL